MVIPGMSKKRRVQRLIQRPVDDIELQGKGIDKSLPVGSVEARVIGNRQG